MKRYSVTIIFTAFFIGYFSTIQASDKASSTEVRTLLLLKLLYLNSNFEFAKIDSFVIAVTGDYLDVRALNEMENVFNAFKKHSKNFRVCGKPIKIIKQNIHSFKYHNFKDCNSMFIVSGEQIDLSKILEYTSKTKIISMAFNPDYIVHGVSLGIRIGEDSSPEILINLAQLKDEGGRFDADILQLAKIY